MSTVCQPWVTKMGWKLQSILFSGLRGPDHALCPNIKEVSRWMRKVSQEDADPSKPYMAPKAQPTKESLEKELEHSSCHFVHHFADALRVIAIHHPDDNVRLWADELHEYIADEIFHFVPETDEVFLHRHRDKVTPPEPEKPKDDFPQVLKLLSKWCQDGTLRYVTIFPHGDGQVRTAASQALEFAFGGYDELYNKLKDQVREE